jgi:hypothetical protein
VSVSELILLVGLRGCFASVQKFQHDLSNREGRIVVMQYNRKRLTAWNPFLLFELEIFLSQSPDWKNLLQYQLYTTKPDEADTELGPLEAKLQDALDSLKVELTKVSVRSGVAPEWSKMKSDIDHVILVLENQSSEGTSSGTDGRPISKKLLAFFSHLDAALEISRGAMKGRTCRITPRLRLASGRPTLKDRVYFHSHTLLYILYYRAVLDLALKTMTDLVSRARLSN